MLISPNGINPIQMQLTLRNESFECVDCYRYLGVDVCADWFVASGPYSCLLYHFVVVGGKLKYKQHQSLRLNMQAMRTCLFLCLSSGLKFKQDQAISDFIMCRALSKHPTKSPTLIEELPLLEELPQLRRSRH